MVVRGRVELPLPVPKTGILDLWTNGLCVKRVSDHLLEHHSTPTIVFSSDVLEERICGLRW